MKFTEKIIIDSVKEYGTNVVQERYKKSALFGFWESEEKLVNKYFGGKSDVLDLACGSGRTALALYKLGYRVTGVDLTPEMIQIAKDTANRENAAISYEVGDLASLNFQDNSFANALLPNNGLASIAGRQNRKKSLQEICRVLQPGGYVIFSIPLRQYDRSYFWHWIKSWAEYRVFSLFGYKPRGADFGDFFYHRRDNGQVLEQVQFLHFFSEKEIEKLLHRSGLEIVEKVFMAELSKKDITSMMGSLAEKENTAKTEIYYVCRKE